VFVDAENEACAQKSLRGRRAVSETEDFALTAGIECPHSLSVLIYTESVLHAPSAMSRYEQDSLVPLNGRL
jgi:hypothetical protein